MNRKEKKQLLCASAVFLILISYLGKKSYHPNYTILNEEDGPFASYSNGLVYIGKEEYLNNLKNINQCDILIKDERDKEDPNMAIINSYNIKDKEKRNEILEIVCAYEEIYPTYWDRSIESMRLEWFCHNVSYYLNYKVNHSEEVDLNNNDEEVYDKEVLRRVLRI